MTASASMTPVQLEAEGATSLYRLARNLLRAALAIYFRRIETLGSEHMPERGPVLLAANHPQSITDALVVAAALSRPVHYLAHAGLFAPRLSRWLLRSCGVLPIHRPRDEADAAQRNLSTFSACTALLSRSGVIGIFPEGTSLEERRVQALRTGVSRIALESEAEFDFQLGVVIVPVGLNFESARRFRSRVLLRFDRPLSAIDYREQYAADPASAVHAMTAEIERRIRRSVVHIERAELQDLIERIERCYHDHIIHGSALAIEGDTEFQRRQTLLREAASAVDYFYERDPEQIGRLDATLHEYERQLQRFRLNDELLRESRPGVRSGIVKVVLWALAGALPGVYGLLFNYIPYRITGPLAQRLATDRTKTHYFQLWVGMVAFSVYYAGAAFLVWQWLAGDLIWALLLLASWPLAGLLARFYVSGLVRQRRLLRLAVLSATHGAAVQQLRRLRQRSIAQLDAMLRLYLPHRRGEEVR